MAKRQIAELSHGFDRTIVGYDLRRKESINSLYLTSYDEKVRFEDLLQEFFEKNGHCLSGINLFFNSPRTLSSLLIPTDAIVVAFDLPTKLVEYLLTTNVSIPWPLPTDFRKHQWQFAGFDIVDTLTQTSALRGFDQSERLIIEAKKKTAIQLNKCGLIESESEANGAAIVFDGLIAEHAPFAPCGIWIENYDER